MAHGITEDDDATARAFIAYYLHDVTASAAEDGHPALIKAAAAERTAWEEHGRLEGRTPMLINSWALQNAVRTGQDAVAGRAAHADFEWAKADQKAVARWLTAHGYRAAAHPGQP
nr:hypothetical protein OG781_00140 [Streptomyces sp. NBC_00830]WTB35897.1 hypothetical protein OG781_46445 [Streptomyces sp. NBC_00830]